MVSNQRAPAPSQPPPAPGEVSSHLRSLSRNNRARFGGWCILTGDTLTLYVRRPLRCVHVHHVSRRGNGNARRRSRHAVRLGARDLDLHKVVHTILPGAPENLAHDPVDNQRSLVASSDGAVLALGGCAP